jgi:peptidoglycan/LPS O-acetylase OafA/YrhL
MEEKKVTMEEIVQSEGWKKFINKMDLYCLAFLVAIFFMIVFGSTDSKYFTLLLTITLMTLAITSFFIAYSKFESESKMLSKWFYKIYGLGASLGFITILFIQENWKFPEEIFSIVAAVLLIISLILGLREITGENKNKLNWKYFLRLFIALAPLIYLMVKKNK